MREFLRKTQLTLLLALGTFPVVLTLFAYAAPQMLPYGWIFPTVYTVLTLLSFLIRGKWRILWGIAGAAILTVPCVMLCDDKTVAVALSYSALLLWSLRIAGWDSREELSGVWVGILASIQLAVQVMPYLLPALMPYQHILTGLFFVFAVLLLMSLNRGSLHMAAGARRSVSSVMRSKNFLLTVGLFASALLFALIPSLLGLLKILYGWVLRLWIWLCSLSQTGEGSIVSGEPEETQHQWGQGLVTEQTPQWMYTMMLVIVLAVVLPVGTILVVKLVKKLSQLLRRWLRAFVCGASAEAEDYEDEISDTREDKTLQRAPERPRRRWVVDERKLTPAQRVRYRYALWLIKNPGRSVGSTARENLPSQAAEVYERARYSTHPVSTEEAERFKAETK